MSRTQGFWLGIAVLIAAGCATGQTEPPEVARLRAQAAYERGLKAFRDKQASLALTAFKEAIDADPETAAYPNALGLLYLQLGRPDLALEEFTRATETDPRFADAHVNRGIALAEQRRWEEAVAAYRVAMAQPAVGANYVLYNNLGMALYNLGRLGEAEEALRFAISLEPGQEPAFYHLGLVLARANRLEEASRAFREANRLAPDSAFGRAASARLREMGEAPPPAPRVEEGQK